MIYHVFQKADSEQVKQFHFPSGSNHWGFKNFVSGLYIQVTLVGLLFYFYPITIGVIIQLSFMCLFKDSSRFRMFQVYLVVQREFWEVCPWKYLYSLNHSWKKKNKPQNLFFPIKTIFCPRLLNLALFVFKINLPR